MADFVRIDSVTGLPSGASQVYTVGERKIAAFNIGGNYFGIDDRCPHNGASLGLGSLRETVVSCPWHAWEFDVTTGAPVGRNGDALRRFPIEARGNDLFIDISPTPGEQTEEAATGIFRYLVRYGAMGWVSRFGSAEFCDGAHGDHVLIRTPRGTEVGEILTAPQSATSSAGAGPVTGQVIRKLTADEEQRVRESCREPHGIMERCRVLCAERKLAIEVIDCELLFDHETTVLYFLGDAHPGMDEISLALAADYATEVLFQPVIEPPAAEHSGGCGSGGCGSGGCGH